jgi:hypothetical protein
MYRAYTKNGAVLIVNTIKTAPFFCVCSVFLFTLLCCDTHLYILQNNFMVYFLFLKIQLLTVLDITWKEYVVILLLITYEIRV